MVDTGELSDVAVAERAGIGWRGKNTLLITPEYGSWVYLGEMITNIPFEPDTPASDLCGSCNQCVKACPTGSLLGKENESENMFKLFDANKRLSR